MKRVKQLSVYMLLLGTLFLTIFLSSVNTVAVALDDENGDSFLGGVNVSALLAGRKDAGVHSTDLFLLCLFFIVNDPILSVVMVLFTGVIYFKKYQDSFNRIRPPPMRAELLIN